MGALEGSLSFKTFYVQGEPPDDFHEGYLQRLQKHFFEPLTPAGEDERSVGWVPVQDPISEGFSRDQVFFNQYIVFAMRIDKWALPAPWVKAMTRKAIQERLPQIEADKLKNIARTGNSSNRQNFPSVKRKKLSSRS